MTESEQARAASAVVVGVDGSDGAKEALRWALAEARLRKAPLRIIHAWTYAYMGAPAEATATWAGSIPPRNRPRERRTPARGRGVSRPLDRRGCRRCQRRRSRASGH